MGNEIKKLDELEKFKKGIFAINTRRFGRIAELMIKELYDMEDPENLAYDLLDKDNNRVEVKFSTVLKKCSKKITSENLIEQVVQSNIDNRAISFNMAKTEKFDCNIQQVKPKEFEFLYYGCFFQDKIMICKISYDMLEKDKEILYSPHQHRGNEGEGQFHINNKTFQHHIENYLEKWYSYEELYELFKK